MVKILILKVAISIILIFGLSCCCKKLSYENLSLNKQDFKDNSIQTDGYYYVIKEENGGSSNFFFLYRNGFFHTRSINDTTISNIDMYIKNLKDEGFQFNWGLFQVVEDKITIEKWDIISGECKQPTNTNEGKILNDTTIQISLFNRNEIYKFRKFTPKPDSTNSYIK
jgi:hypothetical protein